MFDTTRAHWSKKQLIGVCSAVLLLAVFLAAQFLFKFSTSGEEIRGVVLSSASVELARVHGGTHGVVSVQLSSGQTVQALVVSGGSPLPGAHVRVLERIAFSGTRSYEVIGSAP